jgi:C-terminal processing protease CtpA/Prc
VIDIGHDRHGEFFDIQAGDDADVEVLDVQPRDRHLLLMVRHPADRAGLRPADVITYIDHKPVVVWQDALRLIARMEPGARVTLTGNRLGQEFQVVAEVAERPPLDGG